MERRRARNEVVSARIHRIVESMRNKFLDRIPGHVRRAEICKPADDLGLVKTGRFGQRARSQVIYLVGIAICFRRDMSRNPFDVLTRHVVSAAADHEMFCEQIHPEKGTEQIGSAILVKTHTVSGKVSDGLHVFFAEIRPDTGRNKCSACKGRSFRSCFRSDPPGLMINRHAGTGQTGFFNDGLGLLPSANLITDHFIHRMIFRRNLEPSVRIPFFPFIMPNDRRRRIAGGIIRTPDGIIRRFRLLALDFFFNLHGLLAPLPLCLGKRRLFRIRISQNGFRFGVMFFLRHVSVVILRNLSHAAHVCHFHIRQNRFFRFSRIHHLIRIVRIIRKIRTVCTLVPFRHGRKSVLFVRTALFLFGKPFVCGPVCRLVLHRCLVPLCCIHVDRIRFCRIRLPCRVPRIDTGMQLIFFKKQNGLSIGRLIQTVRHDACQLRLYHAAEILNAAVFQKGTDRRGILHRRNPGGPRDLHRRRRRDHMIRVILTDKHDLSFGEPSRNAFYLQEAVWHTVRPEHGRL